MADRIPKTGDKDIDKMISMMEDKLVGQRQGMSEALDPGLVDGDIVADSEKKDRP